MLFQSSRADPRSPRFVGRATKKVNVARLPGGEDKGRLLAAGCIGWGRQGAGGTDDKFDSK